jgi:hypothetical protein
VSETETIETIESTATTATTAIVTVIVTTTTGDMATVVEDMDPMILAAWWPPQLWPHRPTPSMAPLKKQKAPS